MSKGINWNRPRDKLRGRSTENINGDLPSALQGPPRKPAPSKEQMREETADLVAAFLAKNSKPASDSNSTGRESAPDAKPPWED